MRSIVVGQCARPAIFTSRIAPGSTQLRLKSQDESQDFRKSKVSRPQHGASVQHGKRHQDDVAGNKRLRIWRQETTVKSQCRERGNNGQARAREDLATRSLEEWLDLMRKSLADVETARDVWMERRIAGFDLPTKGDVAREMWSFFLRHGVFSPTLIDYALELQSRKKGAVYEPLYTEIMRSAFLTAKSGSDSIIRYHKMLFKQYKIQPNALRLLAPLAAESGPLKLRQFRRIYTDLHEESDSIYDHLIPALLAAGQHDEAISWHQLLEQNNDYANTGIRALLEENYPSFEASMQAGKWLEPAQPKTFDQRGVGSSDSRTMISGGSTLHTPSRQHRVKPKSSNLSAADTNHGVTTSRPAPVAAVDPQPSTNMGFLRGIFASRNPEGERFSDDFCARLFATGALTPSWVISILQAANVSNIGPLALRELALRCDSLDELRTYLTEIKAAKVTFGGSKYSRTLRHLVKHGQKNLLEGLLEDDQHPHNFDKRELQSQLAGEAARTGDWRRVHTLLSLMTLFDHNPQQEYWNQIFRHMIEVGDLHGVLGCYTKIRSRSIRVSEQNLWLASKHLLAQRSVRQKPTVHSGNKFNELRLVTNMVFTELRAGAVVDDRIWLELFKRHGMHSFLALKSFCNSTVAMCQSIQMSQDPAVEPSSSPAHDRVIEQSPKDRQVRAHAEPLRGQLDRYFTQQRLQIIIAWGFIHAYDDFVRRRDQHLRLTPFARVPGSARFRGSWGRGVSGRWPKGLNAPPPASTLLQGLALVQDLEKLGVKLDKLSVERAIRQRIWSLYGPSASSRRKINQLRSLNPFGLRQLLRAVTKMWERPTRAFKNHMAQIDPEEIPVTKDAISTASRWGDLPMDLAQQSSSVKVEARGDGQAEALLKLLGPLPKTTYERRRLHRNYRYRSKQEVTAHWNRVALEWATEALQDRRHPV